MTEILREEIQRIPTAPPRDVDLLPGLRYSKGFRRSAVWLPLLFVVVLPLTVVAMVILSPEGRLATRTTRTAEGKVQAFDYRNVCKGGVRLTYTFATPDGTTWKGRDRVCPPSPYTDAKPGDSIPITYVESDPSTSAVTGGRSVSGLDFFIPLVLVALLLSLVFGAVFWPLARQHVRDRKLFRTGELAKGRVTYVKSRRSDPWNQSIAKMNSSDVYVRARFAAGGEREVRATCTNDWLLAQLPPGAEVHVCAIGDEAMLIENHLR